MRNWLSSINVQPGFLDIVFQQITNFPNEWRQCNLVFDSMVIKKDTKWDNVSKKMIGTCDYGNGITMETAEIEATHVLLFMLVFLRGKWKWSIVYFFIHRINASMLS